MKGASFAVLAALVVLNAQNSQIWSAVQSNSYQSIVDRNVFGLTPPPTLETLQGKSNHPPSKIFLTGLTSILGDPRVLLKTPARPSNPGEPPGKEQLYILKKGERADDIEIIDIDLKSMLVTVSNAGRLEQLSFEKNGVNLVGPPGPPPPPAVLPTRTWFAQR